MFSRARNNRSMIKFIKKWICKILHIKQCKCEDKNEVKQKGLPIINETAKEKKIREKHKGESK